MHNARMTSVPARPSQPLPRLFLSPVDSDLHTFLREVHRLAEFAPAILPQIEADLDAHGLRKKLLREADRRFFDQRTADLPHLPSLPPPTRTATVPSPTLAVGRPRLTAYAVFLFLMLRGRDGGCKDQPARLLLEESMTLHCWLENLGLQLPAASTLSDHLNAVSHATRDFIHRAQLRFILAEGLDDFTSLYLDSTAIAASSEWPTDSGLITKLIERIGRAGSQLARFGLPNFPSAGQPELQKDLRGKHREISFAAGKPKRQSQLKKLYYQLLRCGERAAKRFTRELATATHALDTTTQLPPSKRSLATAALAQIGEDLRAIGQVAATCRRRVFAEEAVPSAEKLVSLSDGDAAFIIKGGWDTQVGYRPQLGKSGQGFVSALLVPLGNAADSGQLIPGVLDHWERTNVLPNLVSTDDGYSSRSAREDLLRTGVAVVSISGSKGKQITPPDDWQRPDYQAARAHRAAVESLIFTLKDGYQFGQLQRRENANVRAELMEKILAYNFDQIIRVRARRARAAQERALTA